MPTSQITITPCPKTSPVHLTSLEESASKTRGGLLSTSLTLDINFKVSSSVTTTKISNSVISGGPGGGRAVKLSSHEPSLCFMRISGQSIESFESTQEHTESSPDGFSRTTP